MAKRHYSNGGSNPLPTTVSGLENFKGGKRISHGLNMISDDWNAPALLPREVMDKQWPAGQSYMNHTEADLFTGVNKGLQEDSKNYKGSFRPGKY